MPVCEMMNDATFPSQLELFAGNGLTRSLGSSRSSRTSRFELFDSFTGSQRRVLPE
jgi:hypothetical protein